MSGEPEPFDVQRLGVDGNKFLYLDINTSKVLAVESVLADIFELGRTRGADGLLPALEKIHKRPEIDAAFKQIKELQSKGRLLSQPAFPDHRAGGADLRVCYLHIIHRCNLHCVYCYADQGTYGLDLTCAASRGSQDTAVMTRETARKAVDFMVNNSDKQKGLTIIFFGGEPLLNFGLIEYVVEYAKRYDKGNTKKFSFSMTSNATVLPPGAPDLMREFRFRLLVSIDGPPEVQDKVRPYPSGRGSYRTVRKNIEKLLDQKGIMVCARATLSHHYPHPYRVVRHLAEMGFKHIQLGWAHGDGAFSLLPEDYDGMEAELRELKEWFVEELLAGRYVNVAVFTDYLKKFIFGMGAHTCTMGRGTVAITPSGDVYGCQQVVGWDAYRFGSLDDKLDHSLILSHPLIKNRDVDLWKTCRVCWARYLCSGCGCPSRSLGTQLTLPNPLVCRRIKLLIRLSVEAFREVYRKDSSKLKLVVGASAAGEGEPR